MRISFFRILCLLILTIKFCNASENELWLPYWEAGNKYAEEKNFEQAIECFSSTIEIFENTEGRPPLFAYNERGMTHYKNKNFREALADFSRVIHFYERNPISSNLPQAISALWSRLGICSRLNLREQAHVILRKLIN